MTLTAGGMTDGRLFVMTPGMDAPVSLESGESIDAPAGPFSIEARGDEGYEFSYWNGIEGGERQIFPSLEDDLTISAVFSRKTYMVSLDESVNGTVRVTPEIKPGKAYPANTVFTIKAGPDAGYEIDSLYYAVPGPWWVNYFETAENEFKVRLTSDMVLGASFISSGLTEGIRVVNNIVYAKPGVKELKYDLFAPEGAEKLPLLIIVHGGGWSSNSEDVMRGMGREIARTGEYVVASIDYRWIGNLDGDPAPNMLEDLIADVYGAIAHVVEHAGEYGADPDRMVITGDSAGGHLSAAAATMIERLGDGGFGEKEGVYEILPTYLPSKMSVDQFRDFMAASLKAAAPSYGVFDISSRIGVSLPDLSRDAMEALSPLHNIPEPSSRSIPHFLVRGTADPLIQNEMVQAYTDALEEAGQEALYVQVPGAGHAFYDWKPDSEIQDTFYKYGIPHIHEMLDFFRNFL